MSHLESLIAEYLEWQDFLVRKNVKVGRLDHGGWEGELDVVGFHPQSQRLVHYEPSIDALSWSKRKVKFDKKLNAGRKYIFKNIFPWLSKAPLKLEQFVVLANHPSGRDTLSGGVLISIDELMAEIRTKITECGPMETNAIPETYPLLRTIQMSEVGYRKRKCVSNSE